MSIHDINAGRREQALLKRAQSAERAHLEAVHTAAQRERAQAFKDVLAQIAREDYRGPMPQEIRLAKRALADDAAAGWV